MTISPTSIMWMDNDSTIILDDQVGIQYILTQKL